MSDDRRPAGGDDPTPPGSSAEPPSPLEWAEWVVLAAITVVVVLLAVFRPTDPEAILAEIRLAAGFDRYQAALDEGDRLYSRATADFRLTKPDEDRSDDYLMLERAVEAYGRARREADGFGEDQRAQVRIARVYEAWAATIHRDATGRWYERNDVEALERARELVREALRLPSITGEQRVRLEALETRIDRAITPWPIL